MEEITYRNGTLYDVFAETASKFNKKTAYEFMGKSVSYAKFHEDVNMAARALIKLGVKEDDIVCIAMPNVPQAITAFYAVNKIGAVANMIHPLSSEQEMLFFLQRVKAKTLIMMDQFYGTIKNIRSQTNLEHVIIASIKEALPLFKQLPYALTLGRKIPRIEKSENVLYYPQFIKLGQENIEMPEVADRTNKMAVILHSGGTTGKIKGVCLSNMSINACTHQMLLANPMIDSTDKMLSVMPIFHGNGLVIGIHSMMTLGGTCVLIPRFTPKSYVHDLLVNKCNYMSGVPALFEKMIETEEIQKADLSFLKAVFSGADALPVETERKINAFLASHNAKIRVRQGYGMTEGVVATTITPYDQLKEVSVGKALPGVIVKICNPDTYEELPRGEVGEICMSSVTNMMGYYEDPEETAITLKKHTDGLTYIHSGDLGYMDEEGFVFFKGRSKRMIITNGYNVFPLALENIINSHEMVEGSCVVGIPDANRGEVVKAFIILKPGVPKDDNTKATLRESFKTGIAKYALPREIEFIDEFPKTKVGKVDYRALINKTLEERKNG